MRVYFMVQEGRGGIARYTQSLRRALGAHVSVSDVAFRCLPGSSRWPTLRGLPLAVQPDPGQSPLHLTQILGCSVLLLRPYRHVLVTVHDLGALLCPADHVLWNPLDRFLLRLSLWGLRRAGKIIAVSDHTRRSLVRTLGIAPQHVHVVHHGLDHERFRPMPNARQQLEATCGLTYEPWRYHLLYVGSELPRKNVGALIKAVARLRRHGYPVRLIKIGCAGYAPGRRETLALIDRFALWDDVVIVERVPEVDLPLFYSAADLFVHPSLYEGFGLPALEAMACGAPVLVSGQTSLPEIVGEAGQLVNARDPDALAATIAELLADESQRGAMREWGRQRAQGFSWESAAAKTAAVYRWLELKGARGK